MEIFDRTRYYSIIKSSLNTFFYVSTQLWLGSQHALHPQARQVTIFFISKFRDIFISFFVPNAAFIFISFSTTNAALFSFLFLFRMPSYFHFFFCFKFRVFRFFFLFQIPHSFSFLSYFMFSNIFVAFCVEKMVVWGHSMGTGIAKMAGEYFFSHPLLGPLDTS